MVFIPLTELAFVVFTNSNFQQSKVFFLALSTFKMWAVTQWVTLEQHELSENCKSFLNNQRLSPQHWLLFSIFHFSFLDMFAYPSSGEIILLRKSDALNMELLLCCLETVFAWTITRQKLEYSQPLRGHWYQTLRPMLIILGSSLTWPWNLASKSILWWKVAIFIWGTLLNFSPSPLSMVR